MQKILGLSLTGYNGQQEFYVLWGEGQNGKTTLTETIRTIYGEYASNMQAKQIMVTGQNDADAYLSQLKNVRILFCSESGENHTLDSELIKLLTGGEPLRTRQKYEKPITFTPEMKLFLITNNKPKIKDNSFGLWRRLRLIPFNYQIQAEERVNNYQEILLNEAPGIINWLIEGYNKYKKEGLTAPSCVLSATNEYKNEEDMILSFVEDCCTLKDEVCSTSGELYKGFKEYLFSIGEKRSTSQKMFVSKVISAFSVTRKIKKINGKTARVLVGISKNLDSGNNEGLSNDDPPDF